MPYPSYAPFAASPARKVLPVCPLVPSLPAARKEMGMLEGRKRLPAEVIRTLESIYTRTPFPSNDVIKWVKGEVKWVQAG